MESSNSSLPLSTNTGNVSSTSVLQPLFPNATHLTSAPASTIFNAFNVSSASVLQTLFPNATHITSAPAPTIFNALNVSQTFDLNNATECIQKWWAMSNAEFDWLSTYQKEITVTKTFTDVLTTTRGYLPVGNASYTTLCDGIPRMEDPSQFTLGIVTLPEPITTTYTRRNLDYTKDPNATFTPPYGTVYPTCSIKAGEECTGVWNVFASSLQSTLSDWLSTNVLTISVPSTPTAMTVNGQATLLTAAPGDLPALSIHGNTYTAGADGVYSLDDAYNFIGETWITPGQPEVTFTWSPLNKPKPIGPNTGECSRPSGTIVESDCSRTAACTITANSVELLFFPPPVTTRDLCANTSPGFNKYTQSIYSQPHQSVVVNGTTFWQDKAYVRYDTISAYKRCRGNNGLDNIMTAVGGTYTNTMIEIESTDVSSLCGWQFNPTRPYGLVLGATPVPLNFDDFNGPVPESAYQCLSGCGARQGCDSIVPSLYNPNLAVPRQVRSLDPAWADCVPYFEGTHDPPIKLTTVSNMFTTAEPTQSASPGGPSSPELPPQTQQPEATQAPDSGKPGDGTQPQPQPESEPPPQPQPQPSNTGRPVFTIPFTETIPIPTSQPPLVDPPAPGNPSVPTRPSNPVVTTIGKQPVVVDPSRPGEVVIGNPGSPTAITLTAGGDSVVVSGTTLSVAPGGTVISVSGSTALDPVTSIGGQPVFIDPAHPEHVIVGDPSGPTQTLNVNDKGIVVISGTTLSMGPTATPFSGPPQTLQVAGMSITSSSDGSVTIVASGVQHTLHSGDPQISVDGHTVFLSPSGTLVVDGQVYNLSRNSAPEWTVVIGPDGSRTTIAMSGATATAEPLVQEQSIMSLASETGIQSSRSGRSSGTITTTPQNEPSSGARRPSSTTSGAAGLSGPTALDLIILSVVLVASVWLRF